MAENSNELMDKLTALCKRRGFIFQSSEIYGGINGFWDYGPLGVELKRNIKDAWWTDIVRKRDDMVGLDCSIIMNPKVWEASGHVSGFADPMVDCKQCKGRFRADKLYFFYLQTPESSAKIKELRQKVASSNLPVLEGEISVQVDHIMRGGVSLSWTIEADASIEKLSMAGDMIQTIQSIAKEKNVGDLKKINLSELRNYSSDYSEITIEGKSGKIYVITVMGYKRAKDMNPLVCPKCLAQNSLTEPRQFNLMLETSLGALQDSSSKAYLRPETAQGIFCNFKNVLDTQRIKLPFGIAQVGKSFRNEINPRNYTFRSREFEQMEIEFFCHPSEADKWYEYWRDVRYNWYITHGLRSSKLRLRNHEKDELAHYARACADIEYEFPFGISELEGVANRTDFDLSQHAKFSGKDMSYFDDEAWEAEKDKYTPDKFGGDAKLAKEAADKAKNAMPFRFTPFVIEPSGGVDRATLAFLCEAYCEDTAPDENGKPQARTVMKFHPRLAPIKLAVFPLVKKEGMPEIARKIYDDAKAAGLAAFYDEKGAVGRRYRRQDEAGTPFCVTVDGQTIQDQTVTIRDRDSLKQERIPAGQVVEFVKKRIG
ncbi:MAG: glycine--tRNA ligase [Planctomycetes bacterium]|nr:glycine--tRNA ligase [Planctomycetota bacterium]